MKRGGFWQRQTQSRTSEVCMVVLFATAAVVVGVKTFGLPPENVPPEVAAVVTDTELAACRLRGSERIPDRANKPIVTVRLRERRKRHGRPVRESWAGCPCHFCSSVGIRAMKPCRSCKMPGKFISLRVEFSLWKILSVLKSPVQDQFFCKSKWFCAANPGIVCGACLGPTGPDRAKNRASERSRKTHR